MPGVSESTWGVWGEPEPIKAWEYGAPKLHGATGGNINPRFSDTLKWFYHRAIHPKDKEHCLRLLAQIEIKKEDNEKRSPSLTVKGRTVTGTSPQSHRRPYSAKVVAQKTGISSYRERPRSAFQEKNKTAGFAKTTQSKTTIKNREAIISSYQRQKQSIDRLSRPKTPAKLSTQQKHIEARPKSAMAAIGRKRYDDHYLTTHEREFPGYSCDMSAQAKRPMSSKGFTAPYQLSGPIGGTTCEQEFGWKEATKNEPIRSGTSSGNRRNNPHPHESFMVWKLPNKTAKGMITATAAHLGYRELSNEVLDQILKDQTKSTYQCDYLGIPQGYQVKDAIDAPADWRVKVRRPLDTTVRHSYVKPQQHDELVGNTTRYGCNMKKSVAALGAVPTVTSCHVKNQEVIKGKTTYHTEFRNRYSQPDLETLLDNQTNKKVLERFKNYSKTTKPRRESTSSNHGPKWLSKWEGPHHHEHQ